MINKRGLWPGDPVRAIAPPDLRDIVPRPAVFYEPFPISRSGIAPMIRIIDRLIIRCEISACLAGPPIGIVEAPGFVRLHLLPVPENVPMAAPGAGVCYDFAWHGQSGIRPHQPSCSPHGCPMYSQKHAQSRRQKTGFSGSRVMKGQIETPIFAI